MPDAPSMQRLSGLGRLLTYLGCRFVPKKNYLPCDEFWLLIVEGSFYSDAFKDVSVKVPTTTFARVFIYRVAESEVVQIK